MAVYKANIVKFEKVSGWTGGGPLYPDSSSTSGTSSTVISAVNAAVAGVTGMSVGETLHVIITIDNDPE